MKDITEEYKRIKSKHKERTGSEETIKRTIGMITENLEELNREEISEFGLGAKVVYAECLEYLQQWERAEDNGIDFEIEKRHPLAGRERHRPA